MVSNGGEPALLTSLPPWDWVLKFRPLRFRVIWSVCHLLGTQGLFRTVTRDGQPINATIIFDGCRKTKPHEYDLGFVPFEIKIQNGVITNRGPSMDFRNFQGEADQACYFFLFHLLEAHETGLIVSEDTDVLIEMLICNNQMEEKAPGCNLQWKAGFGGVTHVTSLYHRIKNDARLAQLKFPVESLMFALLSGGNDVTGGYAGISYTTILDSFMAFPVDIVHNQHTDYPTCFGGRNLPYYPSEEKYFSFIKHLYYWKHKSSLKQFFLPPIR